MDQFEEARSGAGICGDCGVKEGGFHQPGCDMETCPFCGHQLISCDCCYKALEIDCSPGTWTYANGLTEEQAERWHRALEAKGRIRWIQWPNLCRYCGKRWPDLFMDEQWHAYMQGRDSYKILCEDCWPYVRAMIDEAKRERR